MDGLPEISGTAGTISDDLDPGDDLGLPDRVDIELEGDLEGTWLHVQRSMAR